MSELWMTHAVLAFFASALLLYAVFGGADFGAGVLECFVGKHLHQEQEQLIAKAMGPVWEANHIWLILAIVILFTGFPEAYARLSVHLHLPLTVLLLGITLRGCAFTFRAYDAAKEPRSQLWYTRCFRIASLLTPLVIGVIIGGATSGRLPQSVGQDFVAAFITPWANAYAVAIGLFTTALFALVAAVFLCDETESQELRELFYRRVIAANTAVLLCGALVFLGADLDAVDLWPRFAASHWSVAAGVGATLALGPLHWCLRRKAPPLLTRTLGAMILTLVLFGWFAAQYPVLVQFSNGTGLSAYAVAAPAATLRQLLAALSVGSLLILPALTWLLYIFKVL